MKEFPHEWPAVHSVHTCVGGKHLHEVFVVGWVEVERGRGGATPGWKMGLRFVVCEDVTA
jgi:hypothetical protein